MIRVVGYIRADSADDNPRRGYADILSADDYVDHCRALEAMFLDLVQPGTGLLIALQTNRAIPDPDEVARTGASWRWFLTWHSAFIRDGKTNPAELINRVYNSDDGTIDVTTGIGTHTKPCSALKRAALFSALRDLGMFP